MAKYLLNIAPQTDHKIYDSLHRIVARWPDRLSYQHMRLAGNFELSPAFDAVEPSRAVLRLLEADARAVDELAVVVDGLSIEYVRSDADSSGTLYDKIYLSIMGATGIPMDEMMEVVVALAGELGTVEMRRLREPATSLDCAGSAANLRDKSDNPRALTS
jgi:hypothetical protein